MRLDSIGLGACLRAFRDGDGTTDDTVGSEVVAEALILWRLSMTKK